MCIFTCLAVRAVHLEMVYSLETIAFISCLRRFAGRRGIPSSIISDNAGQFQLASTVLKSTWDEITSDADFKCYLSSAGIQWKFIPALAPWQGAVYERLIGLVKRALRKSLERARVSGEQLSTLLIEVESVLNSRPLTAISTDADGTDVVVLTPMHFLNPQRPFGISIAAIPSSQSTDDTEYSPHGNDSAQQVIQLWKRHQNQLNHFWKIWSTDYLDMLQQRSDHHHKQSARTTTNIQLKPGDVVIIHEDDQPRAQWRFGRITDVQKSSTDGYIRTAKVKVPSGKILTRSVAQLHPLELPESSPEVQDQPEPRTPSQVSPTSTNRTRPQRSAAQVAREKIAEWLT